MSNQKNGLVMNGVTPSIFDAVAYTPPDPKFDLTAQFIVDKAPEKVNLGQGTYRDGRGKPWVLPSVKSAKKLLYGSNHEYLPILGLKEFRDAVPALVLGEKSKAVVESRIATCQTLSGTGALHLCGTFLRNLMNPKPIFYITEPTWVPHRQVFEHLELEVRSFRYLDRDNRALDFESFLHSLKEAPSGSVFVLHACAHNPSGCDPSEQQWREIGTIMSQRNLIPMFDAAYLGMVSGDLAKDSFAIRHFVNGLNMEVTICMSFAKIMGIYGERCGALMIVSRSRESQMNIESQLEQLQRREISNPPAFGARIARCILSDHALKDEWYSNLKEMSQRISKMRSLLRDELERLQSPGDWSHITAQGGMFCILGLTREQVLSLKERYHIYMAISSRISVAGINESNVRYIAQCIDAVVRHS